MDPLTIQLFRVDTLTGCNNFLSFVEKLDQLAVQTPRIPFSLLAVDMNHLILLNDSKGHLYGDSVIRWMELVMREESGAPIYRIGGDEFATLLLDGSAEEHKAILQNIFSRCAKEAPPLGIPDPAASIALVRFDEDSTFTPLTGLTLMHKAIFDIKTKRDRGLQVYTEKELSLKNSDPSEVDEKNSSHIDWVSKRLISSFLHMGKLLDDAQQAAYVDSTSALPNFRAAMHKLEQTLFNTKISDMSFSILLMDGDNLRLYNEISYAAGDEMIRRMSTLFTNNLRPGDFIARWRAGDEFIAILPGTHKHGAQIVANRFRAAIKAASQAWEFPTSISIGVATYPDHGTDINALIDKAEGAMKLAKDQGKDQVVITD